MKILALEHEMPDVTAEKFQQHARAEALCAWELHQQGIVFELILLKAYPGFARLFDSSEHDAAGDGAVA